MSRRPVRPATVRFATARRLAVVAAALPLTIAVTSCDGGGSNLPTASPTPETASLEVVEPWVQATDTGTAAAYGTLWNRGGADITIVAAASEAAARVELHETTTDPSGATVTRPVEGGFAIPAGWERPLQPGGDHLVLAEIPDPLEPGEEVTITLIAVDGSETTFTAVATSGP